MTKLEYIERGEKLVRIMRYIDTCMFNAWSTNEFYDYMVTGATIERARMELRSDYIDSL